MKNDLRVEKRGEGIMRHQCICVEVALQVKNNQKVYRENCLFSFLLL